MVWNIVRLVNSMSKSSLGNDRHSWGEPEWIHKTSHPTPLIINKYIHAKSHQSYPTLCNPMDYSHQAPVSMIFSRQEYWSGLPFPSPRDLPNPGFEPTSFMSPAFAGRFFTTGTILEALFIYLFPLLMSPVREHSYGTQISSHFLPIQRGSSHFFPKFWSHKVSSHISPKLPNHWSQPTHCGINHTSGHFSFQSVALLYVLSTSKIFHHHCPSRLS